jgi:branched-chain amino acid transport system substrate-binding protein
LGKDKPNTFRIAPNVLQGVAGCFVAVKQKYPGQIRRIATIEANDATGWAAANAAKVAAKALGWEVVAEEYYERGITDFHPLAGKVLPKKPDLIDTSGCSSIESALIAAHTHKLGYRGKLTGMVIMPEVMAQKGGAGIEGMIGFLGSIMICLGLLPLRRNFTASLRQNGRIRKCCIKWNLPTERQRGP